jgi:hypothetical protein
MLCCTPCSSTGSWRYKRRCRQRAGPRRCSARGAPICAMSSCVQHNRVPDIRVTAQLYQGISPGIKQAYRAVRQGSHSGAAALTPVKDHPTPVKICTTRQITQCQKDKHLKPTTRHIQLSAGTPTAATPQRQGTRSNPCDCAAREMTH